MQYKICSRCEQIKDVLDFYKNKTGYYTSKCKACELELAKTVERRKSQEKFRKTDKRKAIVARYAEKVKKMAAESIITEKVCTACNKLKSVKYFQKSSLVKDGYNQHCKDCRSAKRKLDRERDTLATKRWRETLSGMLSQQKHKLKKQKEILARQAVRNAIRLGDLPKAIDLNCMYCSNLACEYHHHNGYDEKHFLDVIPLCYDCHGKVHRI